MDDYKIVIYDRFCDDVRAFDSVYHDEKLIHCCWYEYNEDAQWYEMTVVYEDKTEEVVKDKLLQFIGECEYKED